MADLAKTDVTVTVSTTVLPVWYPQGRQKQIAVSIAFGDSAKKYPVGGVPMPSIDNFGMVRNLAGLLLQGPTGLQCGYDPTNNKLIIYSHSHVLNVAQGASADAAANSALVYPRTSSTYDLSISQPTGGGGVISVDVAAFGTAANVGGIVAAAPGSLVELANVALAAQIWSGIAYGW
jgi:hypothetical protein